MIGTEIVRLGWKARRGWGGADYPSVDAPEVFPLDWRQHAATADADGAVRRRSVEGPYVHPVETAFRIIADLQTYALTSDAGEREAASAAVARAVETLVRAQLADGSFRYPVPVRRYAVAPGWSSGMAQGLVHHAFSAGATFLVPSSRERVRVSAELALEHLLTPVADGGCTDYDGAGRPFFEECPGRPLPYIFNGAVFAVLGLATSAQPRALEAARSAAERLAEMLPSWDLGYWSRYDLLDRTPSSPDYHNLHVELLRALARRYPDLPFAAAAGRFDAQRAVLRNRARAFSTLAVSRLRATVREPNARNGPGASRRDEPREDLR